MTDLPIPNKPYEVTIPEGGGEYRLVINKRLADLSFKETEDAIRIVIKEFVNPTEKGEKPK